MGPPAFATGAALTGSKKVCVGKFMEWWSPGELLGIVRDISPPVAKMLAAHGVDDAERLSEILYTCVGPRFLRTIDDDVAKRQRFIERLMRAAVKKGDAEEADILDAALRAHGHRFRTLEEVAGARVSERWCTSLALELGLPSSTAKKDSAPKPPDTEVVEPHSPLNPLYDYQYTAGLLVRGMLEGKPVDGGSGGSGRPIKRRLIAVPTGSGKTRMVVETLIEWLNDGKPSHSDQQARSKFIVWVAQTEELCEQAMSSFREVFKALGKRGTALRLHRFWGQAGRLPPMEMSDLLDERAVIVATMQSLDKVLKNDPGQLDRLARLTSCIVIDEAHHSTAKSYSDVLRKMHFNWDNRKKEISELGIVLIGLTATPFRGTGDTVEKANLKRRYGDIVYPDIPYYDGGGGGRNQLPHALIDCQPSAHAGDYIRILGERSYDRDGYIRDDGYAWTIEKTRPFIHMFRVAGEADDGGKAKRLDGRNIAVRLDDPGEYKITLTVTDNEGDTGSASAYLRIRDPPGNAGGGADGAETEVQKRLYHRLIKRQILCDVSHRILPSGDIRLTAQEMEHVKRFGEFNLGTIKGIGNMPDRNRLILDTIVEMNRTHGRKKILFFGCSVEHSRLIAALLKALYGIRAAYVDSRTDANSRVTAIEGFRSGDLEVLCNYGVLTAGFDAPNIDCVFVGRPVGSTLLYTQMIGRGMRGTRSGGTRDMVIIDIDDNFQLDDGQGGLPQEVGWKIYRRYWKKWGDGDGDGDGGARDRPQGGAGQPPDTDAPSPEPGAGPPADSAGPAGAAGDAGTGSGRAGSAPGATRPETAIDKEFAYLRDKEYGHMPTSRQFRARAPRRVVDDVDRQYGGYAAYLKSRGLALRDDPDLRDRLYEAYFSLYLRKRAALSRDDLDLGGDYTAADYEECFGDYGRFQATIDEIVGRMSLLDTGVTRASLFRDYRKMRADCGGRAPHFDEVRRMSGLGIEYYLGLFGTMTEFASAEEYDRVTTLREIEAAHLSLAGLLGLAPNARQMAEHAASSYDLLDSLYPGQDRGRAYARFMADAGIAETPLSDPVPHDVRAKMRQRAMRRFRDATALQRGADDSSTLSRADVLNALLGKNPAPYEEWFGSVDAFADALVSDAGGSKDEGSGDLAGGPPAT